MSRQYLKRKLTAADGELILWHVLEHIERFFRDPELAAGEDQAIGFLRGLLKTFVLEGKQ